MKSNDFSLTKLFKPNPPPPSQNHPFQLLPNLFLATLSIASLSPGCAMSMSFLALSAIVFPCRSATPHSVTTFTSFACARVVTTPPPGVKDATMRGMPELVLLGRAIIALRNAREEGD